MYYSIQSLGESDDGLGLGNVLALAVLVPVVIGGALVYAAMRAWTFQKDS